MKNKLSGVKKLFILFTVIVIIAAGVVGAFLIKSNTPENQYEKQIELGESYLAEDDIDEAIQAFQKAIDIIPYELDAYLSLAKAFDKNGETEEALDILKDAQEEVIDDRDSAAGRITNSEAELLQKKIDRAIKRYSITVADTDTAPTPTMTYATPTPFPDYAATSTPFPDYAATPTPFPDYAATPTPSMTYATPTPYDDWSSEDITPTPIIKQTENLGYGGMPILRDDYGQVYDLEGMEIVIQNYWYSMNQNESDSEYMRMRNEYLEWIQETYNFTIIEQGTESIYGTFEENFGIHIASGGEGNKVYVFPDYNGSLIYDVVNSGYLYDLSSLDCINFSTDKWDLRSNERYMLEDNSIYSMSLKTPKPGIGVYFNKRLLLEAGIDPFFLYELQENGGWTFDMFSQILSGVHRDVDGDGVIDIYGVASCFANMYDASIFANNGSYISKDSNGQYRYSLDDDTSLTGLNWAYELEQNYGYHLSDDDSWDYYKTVFSEGKAAFCVDYPYCAQEFNESMSDDFGFLCFPKGPDAYDYTNVSGSSGSLVGIPYCYDEQKAWNIAFAYNLYTEPLPGYDDSDEWKSEFYNDFRDWEAIELTMERMVNSREDYWVDFSYMDKEAFLWRIDSDNPPAQLVKGFRSEWQPYINEINRHIN